MVEEPVPDSGRLRCWEWLVATPEEAVLLRSPSSDIAFSTFPRPFPRAAPARRSLRYHVAFGNALHRADEHKQPRLIHNLRPPCLVHCPQIQLASYKQKRCETCAPAIGLFLPVWGRGQNRAQQLEKVYRSLSWGLTRTNLSHEAPMLAINTFGAQGNCFDNYVLHLFPATSKMRHRHSLLPASITSRLGVKYGASRSPWQKCWRRASGRTSMRRCVLHFVRASTESLRELMCRVPVPHRRTANGFAKQVSRTSCLP